MSEAWLSTTQAAQRLTALGDRIDRSTLSRYIAKHAEALPTRREGKENRIEFDALYQHRRENVRLQSMPPEVRSQAPTVEDPSNGSRPLRHAGSQSDGAARKVNAEADMREMKLAQMRKELTPTEEVDRAGREAIGAMQSAFERAVESEAASFAVKYGWDERLLRAAFKEFARRGLDHFHRGMLDRIDAFSRAEAAAEQEEGASELGYVGADKLQ